MLQTQNFEAFSCVGMTLVQCYGRSCKASSSFGLFLRTTGQTVNVDPHTIDRQIEGAFDREIMSELYQTCESLRPKIFRLAAEADENDPVIGKFRIYILLLCFLTLILPSEGQSNQPNWYIFKLYCLKSVKILFIHYTTMTQNQLDKSIG